MSEGDAAAEAAPEPSSALVPQGSAADDDDDDASKRSRQTFSWWQVAALEAVFEIEPLPKQVCVSMNSERACSCARAIFAHTSAMAYSLTPTLPHAGVARAARRPPQY